MLLRGDYKAANNKEICSPQPALTTYNLAVCAPPLASSWICPWADPYRATGKENTPRWKYHEEEYFYCSWLVSKKIIIVIVI